MNQEDNWTPQAASDIEFPSPRKSFVLPRALAAADLYTDNGAENGEDFVEEHGEQTTDNNPNVFPSRQRTTTPMSGRIYHTCTAPLKI